MKPAMQAIDDAPDLTGRLARCGCTRQTVPSSVTLAFFEFRGEGSHSACNQCRHCGYYEVAHRITDRPFAAWMGHEFEPHGAYEFDLYYCGHGGWD